MNSAKLNDWLQVFGIFALVASLIFVGLQIRQDRDIATIEAMSARSDAISNLAELIGNNKAFNAYRIRPLLLPDHLGRMFSETGLESPEILLD